MNNINYYAYLRVSTEKQNIVRQSGAIEEWQKNNNINIPKENIFVDYYTGKTFDRENYQRLKSTLKQGDYLIVKEVDRLGRDWNGIKKEWQELKDNDINIIIIDWPILSDCLPGQTPKIQTLDDRLIKEQMLTLMCYSAQKEREEISRRTKEILKQKKEQGTKSGKPMGHPKSQYNNKENFIATLKYQINKKIGYRKACLLTKFPTYGYCKILKDYYIKYNTKDLSEILRRIESEEK